SLNKIAFRKMTEVVLHFEVKLHFSFWRGPFQVLLPLCQVAVEERPKPGCGAKLQGPVSTRLCFQPPAREVVRAGWNDNAARNLKRHQQGFAMWIPIELEAISRLEAHIDRSHEVFP